MKNIHRTYLMPKHMRLGQPQITFVTRETLGAISAFWLNVAYGETRFTPKANGTLAAYGNRSSVSITEEFYRAFLKEAALNKVRFAKREV